ncbi:uncharacterized protein LOC142242973 [Haematobia irritans]|uniref:uncharacterized protein LOC142242973 n=1 Tax=Haematobia irritans TaxID=7368 RepID=UPI003F50CADE
MRSFIFFCLVALAYGDKLGYNYKPVEHSTSGLSFTPGGVSSGSYNSGGSNFGSSGGFTGGIASGGSYGGDGGSYGGESGGNTEFFTFTANEEDFGDADAANRIASASTNNRRVIFIKGPENNALENAAFALAKNAASQKTAIYVLNKQVDLGELSDKLNQVTSSQNNKPDVHFVKYRTPEDAANAQHAIQSQYSSHGGHTQNFNGGVAPVINFASHAAHGAHHGGSFGGPSSSYLAPGIGGALNPSYLPANIFRRFRRTRY